MNELTIKFVSQSDIVSDSYIEKMNDSDLHKYTSHANFNYARKDALDFWGKIEKKEIIAMGIYDDVNLIHGIICSTRRPFTKPCFELKGICCLQEINWINRTAEIVFLVFEKKQGFGFSLGNEMIQHAFNKLNLNKVWLGCVSGNIAMIKLANKLGMKQEGILKNHIWLDRKYVDVYRYCYLKK